MRCLVVFVRCLFRPRRRDRTKALNGYEGRYQIERDVCPFQYLLLCRLVACFARVCMVARTCHEMVGRFHTRRGGGHRIVGHVRRATAVPCAVVWCRRQLVRLRERDGYKWFGSTCWMESLIYEGMTNHSYQCSRSDPLTAIAPLPVVISGVPFQPNATVPPPS